MREKVKFWVLLIACVAVGSGLIYALQLANEASGCNR